MKYKIIFIGLGSIGERHLRCFLKTGLVEPIICDARRELVDEIAQKYDVQECYTDFKDLLNLTADAAVIATPAHLHISMAKALAEKGMHLLIEKALSTNLDGIDELKSIESEKELQVHVGYSNRAHPAVRKMKNVLDSGSFGKPLHLVGVSAHDFSFYRPNYKNLYYASHQTGGGSIQDAMTHLVNLGEWLLGPLDKMMIDAKHQKLEGVEVEDTVNLIARHGSVLASYTMNHYQTCPEFCITLNCENGTLRFDRNSHKFLWQEKPNQPWQEETWDFSERDDLYVAQASHFLNCLKTSDDPLCSLEEGEQSLKVNLKALESIQSPPWQEI